VIFIGWQQQLSPWRPAAFRRGYAAQRLPPGDYVDVHTHLGQTWNTTEPLTAEELLRWT
jgi:hypothetical protein